MKQLDVSGSGSGKALKLPVGLPEDYIATAETGLSAAEAQARLQAGQANRHGFTDYVKSHE